MANKPKKNVTKSKKKTTTKKTEKKFFINGDNYLYYIFFALLIFVIFLGIRIHFVKKTKSIYGGDLIIPVMEKSTNDELTINLKELSNRKEYVINITNFKNKKINKEEIDYKIIVTNPTSSKIKITKNYSEENLITDQKETTIDNQKLRAKTKHSNKYHISVTDAKKIKKNDKITIKIYS